MPTNQQSLQTDGGNATNSVWRYSLATEYETPAKPAAEKAKTGLSAFWRRFWPAKNQSGGDPENADWPRLSDSVLNSVLPQPHGEAAATSLAAHLNPWLHELAPESLLQAVIGPPGSGVQDVVARWGHQVNATLLTPPDPARLLEPEADYWTTAAGDTEGVLVIPALEKFYLRHADGLDLIRQLAEWLWSSPRRIVVGCDSWAWAYLCKTVQIDAVFRTPIALEALDGDALRAWLRPRPRGRYLVQSSLNGEVIYPIEVAADDAGSPGETAPEDEAARYKGADIFQRIAAMSRGIPEVALAYWRECLCEGDADANEQDSSSVAGAPVPVRVRPPQSLVMPALPPSASTREAIVLHSLLLHAGLPISILCRVVAFPASDIIGTLSLLRQAGVVIEQDGLWKVTPLSYTSVRAFIRAETLLIDLF